MAEKKTETKVEKARVETLYEKIANIREMVEAIQKNKQGYGYKYVSEDEVLAKVSAGLKKYQIDVYPRIVPNTMQVVPYTAKKNKVLKDGTILEDCINEIIVSAEMEFEWVNLENPEDRIIIPWTIVGQQSDASQAFGSGLTYCMRYFYLKFFKTATVEDDPDNWRSKQKEAFEQESRLVAQEIINTIDEIAQKHITEENRKEFAEVVKGIVKINGKATADYRKITDPETASKLLETVKKFFNV